MKYKEKIDNLTIPKMFTREEVQLLNSIAAESAARDIFKKFDEFACIKNDKWYLDYKEKFLKEV